jgi:hypothetical protein
MNDMRPVPRSKQTPISFRSNEAAKLLAELTSDGRSQADVMESALRREREARPKLTREEFKARLDAIAKAAEGLPRTTYRELRAPYYDENGLPI